MSSPRAAAPASPSTTSRPSARPPAHLVVWPASAEIAPLSRLFVEFFVDDLPRARDFYPRAIGMTVVREEPDHIILRLGEAQLHLGSFAHLTPNHYLRSAPDRLGA